VLNVFNSSLLGKKSEANASIQDGLILFVPDICIFKTNVEKTFVLSKFLK